MAWRRNSLYRQLDLPKEPEGAGLHLSDYTIDTSQAHLETLGQPTEPEQLCDACFPLHFTESARLWKFDILQVGTRG